MSVAASACAIHPLPDDVTGVSTYTIVRQIRCETKEAIIGAAVAWLTSGRAGPDAEIIGVQIRDGLRPKETFGPGLFTGPAKRIVALFFETGVASHFELEMAETNNVGAEINLLKPFTTSRFTMGIGANADRVRQNTRTFAVTDTFKSLIQLPPHYCDSRLTGGNRNYVVGENPIYPIAGRIGADRLVRDFIELSLFGGLAGPKDGEPPTLVDQLEFSTTISSTLSPKVTFSPVGTSFSVTDASITGHVSRRDLHKMTMGLAVAGPGSKLLGPVRSALFTPLISVEPRTTAQERAAAAVNQALTLKLFRPNLIVTP